MAFWSISLNRLNKRERYAVIAAIFFISFFVLMELIVFPLIDQKARLQRVTEVKTKALQEMILLKSEWDAVRQKAESSRARVAKREKGFTLFSFLEKLAREAGVKDHIAYMKPSTSAQKDSRQRLSTVEMKLQSINLKQLTAYLHKIETSKENVFINKISISKTGRQERFISSVLQVEAFEMEK